MRISNISTTVVKLILGLSILFALGCSDRTVRPTQRIEVPVAVEVESFSLNFGSSENLGSVAVNITAPSFLDTDDDTATESGDNDDSANAQPIGSDVVVSGYVDQDNDISDWYSVVGTEGEVVRLDIDTDSTRDDLDLSLFKDLGDGTGEFVDSSFSVTNLESLVFPEDGDYFVEVNVFSGAAAYLLSVAESETIQTSSLRGSRLSLLASSCDSNDNCSSARSGQWIMTTSRSFSKQMEAASKNEIAAAQEDIIESMGMTLDGGAGTGLLKTGMQDYSAEGWVNLAASVGLRAVPWGDSDSARLRFSSQDDNGDGIPDQQELLLTALIGKKVNADEAISSLRSVGLNFTRTLKVLPNDDPSLIAEQFASHYSLIRLEQAWDSQINNSRGLEEVLVAVLDTGIAPLTGPEAHPDWANVDTDASDSSGKLRYGFDFVSDPDIDGDDIPGIDSDATDIGPANNTSFHGTHVAGTVAAPTGNGIGVAGVGRSVSIMPLRVLGDCGCGSTFDILQGNLYAAQLPNSSDIIPRERADIINMSLGGGGFSRVAQDVYEDVRAQGVIIIAAAGNESTDEASYPASYEGIVSVSAAAHGEGGTPADVVLTGYSNFGATVDVAAPGGRSFLDANGDGFRDGVLSTVGLPLDSSGYAQFNGTSMAAPHVAGVAALMESVHRGLTPDEFDNVLNDRTIVLDVGGAGRDDSFGSGLIDAFNAVRIAEQLAGISPTPQPEPLPQPADPVATAAANPTSLNFGSGLVSLDLELRNSGDPRSTIEVLEVATDSPALRVMAANVDRQGLGTYVATLDRELLDEGTNQFQITFDTNANDLTVAVNAVVREAGEGGNAGALHVVLLDAASLRQENCALLTPEEGLYTTEFADVESGDYFLLAGSDTNGDGLICGPFEACGAYEGLGNITQITDEEVDLWVNYSLFDQFPSGQFRGCVGSPIATTTSATSSNFSVSITPGKR